MNDPTTSTEMPRKDRKHKKMGGSLERKRKKDALSRLHSLIFSLTTTTTDFEGEEQFDSLKR